MNLCNPTFSTGSQPLSAFLICNSHIPASKLARSCCNCLGSCRKCVSKRNSAPDKLIAGVGWYSCAASVIAPCKARIGCSLSNNQARRTPNVSAIRGALSALGIDSPFSHFLTACADTPNKRPRSFCLWPAKPASLRASLKRSVNPSWTIRDTAAAQPLVNE